MTLVTHVPRTTRPSITMSQRAIYHLLKHLGPAADADLIALTNVDAQRLLDRGHRYPTLSPSGTRTRRAELVAKGYVVDTGEKMVMPSGRRARIWKAL